ncbi:MAG TPA: SDR family NAD(P)-dependent oxidoreductase [Candidatus Elarobacter sp.]|nr:SDR family NAD(P)-dependent oxidoreductase [Candidatus Elarobacter sp.]
MQLIQKRVVVTGGSSGIGAELAAQLASRGNAVVLVANDAERLRRTSEAIRARTGAAVTYQACDIGRSAEIDAAAERLLADGPVDVLVNNAGYGVYRAFEAEDVDEIDRLLAVNLAGHVRMTKRLLGPMVARRSGAISFVASIAGRLPITPNATYCAAKHGMFGLAEALRYELRRFGVEVTAVCPGRVDTPFFDHPTFRERTRGPENSSAIGVERVGRAIIGAIERARPVTYVPGTLGLATWLYESLPPITRPLFSRVMGARIERLYADVSS